MNKNDIIRKLTSRKFWLAVASFVTMLIVYFTNDQGRAEQIAALIMAGATVLCYLFSEGMTDAANIKDGDDQE